MKTLRKISDAAYKAIMYSVSAVLAIMILVAFIEVIRRYLFGKTFLWSDDLIRYLIITCTNLCKVFVNKFFWKRC